MVMPAIHVRDIPEEVLNALKRRAASNERSLQQELRFALRKLAMDAPPAEPLPPVELELSDAAPQGRWRREEIYNDDGR